MAVGTAIVGSGLVVQAAPNAGTESSPSAGTYAPVSDLNSFSKNSNRNTNSFGVFNKAVSYSIPGSRDQTYTLSGFISIGDTGMATILNAEAANTTIYIKVLWDGTNGFSQAVKVGSRTVNATPDGLIETSYDLSAVADPVVVGTGPIA